MVLGIFDKCVGIEAGERGWEADRVIPSDIQEEKGSRIEGFSIVKA
jgi:hypothetical protein